MQSAINSLEGSPRFCKELYPGLGASATWSTGKQKVVFRWWWGVWGQGTPYGEEPSGTRNAREGAQPRQAQRFPVCRGG